ncbi:MAG: acyltransferase [Paludibacteraceae bacterium]
MISLLNRIISRIKGESFYIDNKIGFGYLIFIFLEKGVNFINGLIVLNRVHCYIHPSSIIKFRSKIKFQKNLSIDRWCYIDALSTEGILFGKNVSIGKFTSIECSGSLKQIGKGLIVGDNVGLGTRGHYGCAGGVIIGNDTIIGNNVSFHSENHNFDNINIPIRSQGVTHKGIKIGNNCWIGAKATFLDGCEIGNGCVVAAGAIVKDIFPDNSVIAGVPAKIVKKRD